MMIFLRRRLAWTEVLVRKTALSDGLDTSRVPRDWDHSSVAAVGAIFLLHQKAIRDQVDRTGR